MTYLLKTHIRYIRIIRYIIATMTTSNTSNTSITSRVYFFIQEEDKDRFTGLSVYLRQVFPDIVKRCSKFKKTNEYVVNISLKSIISRDFFEIIIDEIFKHFDKKMSIFYKNCDCKKYEYSYIHHQTDTKPKKYTFIDE